MKPTFLFSSLPRLACAGALALLGAALLAACGGGGGDAGTAANPPAGGGTATPSSYSQGPISGFGSVVVGGVRYDDSTAAVTDADGNTSSSTALKLGMQIEVEAGAVDRALGVAIARRIRWGSEVVGPLGAVDTATSTVKVLGQTVLVTSSTVFDSTLSGGLSALAALPAGTVLEVHGFLGTGSGRITATRIEPRPNATSWRLRGVIDRADTTAKTFTIGSEVISYSAYSAANPALPLTFIAAGNTVRVQMNTTQVSGAWVATRLSPGARWPDAGIEARIEGTITAYTSATAFEVNGLKVDAAAASFPDGTAGIVLGARVEVSGTVTNGTMVASKVELEDRRNNGLRNLELRGDMSNLDTTAKTFALRGVTVWYGAAGVVYADGTEATLANGKRVEVRGVISADRTRLEAKRIEFKN
jgi:hypothetical protein